MACNKHITILAPTAAEAEAVAKETGSGVEIITCGVGTVETSATLTRLHMERHLGGLVILAGIAGAFKGSGFNPGDSAVAVSETLADLGAARDGCFVPLYTKIYTCPLAETITSVRRAGFGTVNCVNGPGTGASGYEIENMEGAAFFAVCSALRLPFIEVRAVSNLVTEPRDRWQIPLALESLAGAVKSIIKELE